jgi:uncharacterized membrane-anchored protein YitT (DUF2179 family)
MNNPISKDDIKFLIDYYHSERNYLSNESVSLFSVNTAILSFFISVLSVLIALAVAKVYLIIFLSISIIINLPVWIKYYKQKKALHKYHSLINKKAMDHFDKLFPNEFQKPKK